MDKKNTYRFLTLRQAIVVLVLSWMFTLIDYYLPFGNEHRSLAEIFTYRELPFVLFLLVVLHYVTERKARSKQE